MVKSTPTAHRFRPIGAVALACVVCAALIEFIIIIIYYILFIILFEI